MTNDEAIDLTWYDIGDPLLIHTEPGERPYGVCTVLIPALGARLTCDDVQAKGKPFATTREGQPVQHLRTGVFGKLDRGALTRSHREGTRPGGASLAGRAPGRASEEGRWEAAAPSREAGRLARRRARW